MTYWVRPTLLLYTHFYLSKPTPPSYPWNSLAPCFAPSVSAKTPSIQQGYGRHLLYKVRPFHDPSAINFPAIKHGRFIPCILYPSRTHGHLQPLLWDLSLLLASHFLFNCPEFAIGDYLIDQLGILLWFKGLSSCFNPICLIHHGGVE